MRLRFLILFVLLTLLASCRSVRLADADNAFERGEYFEAQKLYREVYNKLRKPSERELRGSVALRLGECYSLLNIPGKASVAYQNSLRYHSPDSCASWLGLARAQQSLGDYAKAEASYENSLKCFNRESSVVSPGVTKENFKAMISELTRGCRVALENKANDVKTRYEVRPAKSFSSARSEFSPMYVGAPYDRIYYTTTSETALGDSKSPVTGLKRGDIFMSRKDENGNWLRGEPAGGDVNTDMDEGTVAFSSDGRYMYFSRAERNGSSQGTVAIYVSERNDASWSEPEKVMIAGDTLTVAGHPSVSPDGVWLYFVSDRKGGYGGLDIWRVNLTDGSKMYPQNLGPQINTPGNEMFPHVRTNSVIYFASDGHAGYGGLDLFKASLNSTGEFWNVENMGQPVNSGYDDFGITFADGENGFFSSNRGDAKGHDHIFSFSLPDIHVSISGIVTDRDEEPVPGAVIRIVGDDGSMRREISRDDGSFRFNIDRGVNYVMKAGADGYLNVKQEFTSDNSEEDAEYAIDFVLTAINKPNVVENIFYDFDKATLRPESSEALAEIVEILNDNPHISIELASHTDRKGSEAYNQSLSERRAKAVVDYLATKGINPARLTYKGYGEKMPKRVTKKTSREFPEFEEGTLLTEEFIEKLPEDLQEKADQINRRTEFRVVSTLF